MGVLLAAIVGLGVMVAVPIATCVAVCHKRPWPTKDNPNLGKFWPDDPPPLKRQDKRRHEPRHAEVEVEDDAATPPTSKITVVRLYIGSHEKDNEKMAGTVPGVVLFDDHGERIGEFESKSEKTVPGGFRDIAIVSMPGKEDVKPAYLHLVAGKKDICISVVAVLSPDGTAQAFSGDELDYCKGVAKTSKSRTVIGDNGLRPKCFWLHAQQGAQPSLSGLSIHLPDFTPNQKRISAYLKNLDLACAASPRLFAYHNGEGRSIKHPIHIFDPPLEYHADTGLDKDPSRVLKWASQKDSNTTSYSDRVVQPAYPIRIGDSMNATNDEAVDTSMNKLAYSSITEQERARTEPPKLVVSDHDISARAQCLIAPWEQADYLSLSEKLFCDMQSRTLVPMCDDKVKHSTCFDGTTHTLKGLETIAALRFAERSAANATTMNSWQPTGALFGYQYTNVLDAY